MSFYIPPGAPPSEPRPETPQVRTPAQEPTPAGADHHNSNIPDELALLPRWLLVDPASALVCGVSGYLIEGDLGPHHWAALDHVIATRDGTNCGDLSLAFALGRHGDEGFIGLALRNGCLADGTCAAWAQHLLGVADTYTESIEGGGLQCVIRVPVDDYRTLVATFGERHVKPIEDGLAELYVGGVLRLSGVHRPPFPGVAPLRAGICGTLAALLAVPRPEEPQPKLELDVVPELPSIDITVLTKEGGPLTKRISLDVNGVVVADGSACVMSHGAARRERCDGLAKFGALIAGLQTHEALALGVLREDLPDHVTIVTKAKLNGEAVSDVIARTHHNIIYRAGRPALALIDFDSKGMPPWVRARLAEAGSIWAALVGIVPELGSVGRVIRSSTSAGLYRSDTGEQLPGSQNQHIYVLVKDGADIERFLRCLHDRCRLAGYGWFMVGAGGQLLERSIIDRMVGAPERLVFEGPPVLAPPVAQDAGVRVPSVIEGAVLDTITACAPLSVVEQARLSQLQVRLRAPLKEAAATARATFVAEHAAALARRTDMQVERARQIIEHQCAGVLLPDVVLPFDDPALAGCTVADVLADPEGFEGATLADPLEGVAYGTCKARIMRRSDGALWIHSFAHGRTVYELKLDFPAAKAAIEAAPVEGLARRYVEILLASELTDAEITTLRQIAAKRGNLDRTDLRKMEKAARKKLAAGRAQERREQRDASRTDPRPRLLVPRADAEWLPVMDALNEVLGASKEPEPPMRDIDGVMTSVRLRRIPDMHLLTSAGANAEEAEEDRLPAPEQPLLTRLTVPQTAELIERHIEYVDDEDIPVHLPTPFVIHYVSRPEDDTLPVVTAIATLPMVLADGTILSGRGLDRERGIVFRIPKEIEALLPHPKDCNPDAVQVAMRFLLNDWLCDVATDTVGKFIIIAAGLTLIERSLIPERPVFFVTAGRRGSGKTMLIMMLLMAITGTHASATAWSPNEEERRKALITYLQEGLAAIVWDNIPRGEEISCPHIERACTTAFYSDRRLGVNARIIASAAAIQFFTGNNVAPKGDLASRNLQVPLDVDRPDPENRDFRHPFPLAWTEANRAKILHALYTILLGNPRLSNSTSTPPRTRFKLWWHLAGSAVEHAAHLCGASLDFQQLFLVQEDDEAEGASLGDMLSAVQTRFNSSNFTAAELTKLINDRGSAYCPEPDRHLGEMLAATLYPKVRLPPNQNVSPISVGIQLKKHLGNPVRTSDGNLILRRAKPEQGPKHATSEFYVQLVSAK